MDWFRWHHGTATDPKWRVIASDADTTIPNVLSVWALMLEHASNASERGTLEGWNDRVAAAALGLPQELIASIREAMQGLTLEDEVLPAWEKRQPKREDNSAERAKAWRERKRTQANASERNVTPEQNRAEQNREDTPNGGADAPNPDKDLFDYGKRLLGKKAGGQVTKLKQAFGIDGAMERLRMAETKSNPSEYVAAICKRVRDGPDAAHAKWEEDYYQTVE